MPTHEKGRDRDKYYQLAKDQGYRSRAAFKLIQINKRYNFLQKSKVCIDLCAAPGGWCQIAAKYMPAGSLIIGVDLLPIKPIRGVKTFVGDITTASCRKQIIEELQGWKADAVLCDGAPNIGAAYNKDAFVQNELVLAALKTASDHLNKGGVFCTKVYRSVDYNALMWVLQQLFEDIQTMKPNSSRSQSSEIFVVCMGYTAPKSVDAKLFDPNHVFKDIDDPGLKKPDVLHKKYETSYKRQRSGYDESLGMTLRASCSLTEFFQSHDAVRLLTDMNLIECKTDQCKEYYEHPLTTPEIKIALSDLKVLGKIDFKKMLKWRQQVKDILHPVEKFVKNSNEKSTTDIEIEDLLTPEEKIQEEITQLRLANEQQTFRDKKKKLKLLAKERVRQASGMNNNAFEVSYDGELFAMDPSMTKKQLSTMNDVKLDEDEDFIDAVQSTTLATTADESSEDEQLPPGAIKGQGKRGNLIVLPANELESDLEDDYQEFMTRRRTKQKLYAEQSGSKEKDPSLLEDTYTAKQFRKKESAKFQIRSKQAEDEELIAEDDEDQDEEGEEEEDDDDMEEVVVDSDLEEIADTSKYHLKSREQKNVSLQQELQEYLDYLSGNKPGDVLTTNKKKLKHKAEKAADAHDDDTSDEDNNEDSRLVTHDEVSLRSKTGKWFANPLFSTTSSLLQQYQKNAKENQEQDEIEDYMPKTDKEKRKEKRLKDQGRQEKKEVKKRQLEAILHAEDEDVAGGGDKKKLRLSKTMTADGKVANKFDKQDFEVVPKNYSARGVLPTQIENHDHQDDDAENNAGGVEGGVLGATGVEHTRHDPRHYDSDEEEYDNHDRMMTLALGTYMLQPSRKKAMIDASYNRYAWNDPSGLPSWFLDDEMRHNKPQIPVPNALLDQIKNKYQLTGTKVVKKVAEARARKKKRALLKLKAAKKQANLMADNSELSERQKVKAIAKAMKNHETEKPGKVYVTTRKTQSGSSGTMSGKNQGKLKFVDKRLKKDKRATRVREKRSKKIKRLLIIIRKERKTSCV